MQSQYPHIIPAGGDGWQLVLLGRWHKRRFCGSQVFFPPSFLRKWIDGVPLDALHCHCPISATCCLLLNTPLYCFLNFASCFLLCPHYWAPLVADCCLPLLSPLLLLLLPLLLIIICYSCWWWCYFKVNYKRLDKWIVHPTCKHPKVPKCCTDCMLQSATQPIHWQTWWKIMWNHE